MEKVHEMRLPRQKEARLAYDLHFFQVATNQHRVTGILESLKIEFTTGK